MGVSGEKDSPSLSGAASPQTDCLPNPPKSTLSGLVPGRLMNRLSLPARAPRLEEGEEVGDVDFEVTGGFGTASGYSQHHECDSSCPHIHPFWITEDRIDSWTLQNHFETR